MCVCGNVRMWRCVCACEDVEMCEGVESEGVEV